MPGTLPAFTKPRHYRMKHRVTLLRAALLAPDGGLSLTRASEIERFPERAKPGELERLRQGVDRARVETAGLNRPGMEGLSTESDHPGQPERGRA